MDTQGDRLELLVIGWGEGMERWVVDHQVLMGNPSDLRTWDLLDEQLKRRYRHASGVELAIVATAIDSGGHHSDEVYQFARLRRWRNVLAIRGHSKPGRPVIAQRPSKVDVTWQGKTEKGGVELWMIGTDTAKDWIYNRYPLSEGPGALHFSKDLADDFYDQIVAERKITRFVKGHKRTEYVKAKSARNEGLDLLTYNLAMAHYLGMNRYSVNDWARLRQAVSQASLFADPVATVPSAADEADEHEPQGEAPSAPVRPAPPRAEREPTIPTNWPAYLAQRVSEPPIDEVSMSTAQQRLDEVRVAIQDILKKGSRCARETARSTARNWRVCAFWSSSTPKPQPWRRLRTTAARARFASTAEARGSDGYPIPNHVEAHSQQLRGRWHRTPRRRLGRARGGAECGSHSGIADPAQALASGGEE